MSRIQLLSLLIILNACLSCNQAPHQNKLVDNTAFTCYNCDSLIDSISSTKFYLDSSKIYITAIDSKGKILWKTDPWKDNNIEEYRVKRPTIVYFQFGRNKLSENKEEIGISYNNSQFGYVEKASGKYTLYGQD